MKKRVAFLPLVLVLVVAWFARPLFLQPSDVAMEAIDLATMSKSTEVADYLDDHDPGVIPTFTEVDADYEHAYYKNDLPFVGSALIDVNGDGVDEVFVGGHEGGSDALLMYKDGIFVDVASDYDLDDTSTTYGALSLDFDNDDLIDLLVAKADHLVLYINLGGAFVEEVIELPLAENALPVAMTAGDINNDGLADLYVSTFIKPDLFKPATFNVPSHTTPNILLVNQGDGSFTDMTEVSGLSYSQNTFLSAFADLNGDQLQDLVIAPNTDTIRIYENVGSERFVEVDVPGDYGFWMGLAIADIDHDGDFDIYMSNSGNTIPRAIGKGDLRDNQRLDTEWTLLRNDGNMQFTQANAEFGLTGFEFGWGSDLPDLNLDQYTDLIVTENYIKWPAHKLKKLPGRVFLQNAEKQFLPANESTGLDNKYFGMNALTSDFNQDGHPDVVFVNLDGPVRAFISEAGPNHYLKVRLPDNANSLGAVVTVRLLDDTSIVRQMVSGTGFMSDQSSTLMFGLGNHNQIQSVEVQWSNGELTQVDAPEVDRTWTP